MMKIKSNNIPILHLITFFSSLYFYHQIVTLYFQERGLNYVQSKYAYLLEKTCGVRKGILIATLFPGIFYLLMATISSSWISILLFIAAYSSMNLQKPIFADYINRHTESKNRATVLSLISMVSGMYIAFMGSVIGGIADISLSYAFLFMGSIIIVSTLLIRIEDVHVT